MKKIILLSLVALFSAVTFASAQEDCLNGSQCSFTVPQEGGKFKILGDSELPSGYNKAIIFIDGELNDRFVSVELDKSTQSAWLIVPYWSRPRYVEIYLEGGYSNPLIFSACVCPEGYVK